MGGGFPFGAVITALQHKVPCPGNHILTSLELTPEANCWTTHLSALLALPGLALSLLICASVSLSLAFALLAVLLGLRAL